MATRFAQLAQTLAPQLPADVIGAVKDRARVADAPEGMADLCEAVLLDCDAATGIRTVVREHGPASALYAAAAMTASPGRWTGAGATRLKAESVISLIRLLHTRRSSYCRGTP